MGYQVSYDKQEQLFPFYEEQLCYQSLSFRNSQEEMKKWIEMSNKGVYLSINIKFFICPFNQVVWESVFLGAEWPLKITLSVFPSVK